MAFSKFLTGFSKKDSPSQLNYLALTLTPEKIIACIWAFSEDKVAILGLSEKPFLRLDNLIHQAAAAIDKAGEKAKTDVSKTVFGLSEYWFRDGKLGDECAKTLKNLAHDLELDPQAFVSQAASINHLLKIEESVTPQAVLAGVFENFCEVHLIKNNKVAATESLNLTPQAAKVKELVAKIKEQEGGLPSRLTIFGSGEKSALVQKIANADWQDLFAHEPRIDILDNEDLARATAYAQAADLLGYEPSLGANEDEGEPEPEPKTKSPDNFGFIEGEDILAAEKQEESEALPKADESYAVDLQDSEPYETAYDAAREKRDTGESKSRNIIAKLFGVLQNPPSPKKFAIILCIFLILVLGAGFIAGQTLVNAEIIIKAATTPRKGDFQVNINPSNSFDPSDSRMPGQLVGGKASGNQKAVVSGKKKIGDKAHGEVTIFNWTSSPKKFPNDTVIISKNGFKFTLDNAVEATSASIHSASDRAPGKANVNVTAEEAGSDYNLPGGQDFTFSEYDELFYSAQSNQAFSGGQEREVTVVTKEDFDKLEGALAESLAQKAKQNLRDASPNLKINDDAIIVKTLKRDFDRKLDEEASLLNLNMEQEASAIAYDEKQLKELLAQIVGDIPENLQARAEDMEILDARVTRSGSTLTIAGSYRANLIPKFNSSDLRQKIAGKSTKSARGAVLEAAHAQDVTIRFSPDLSFFGILPRNKEKISFSIETD